MTANELKRCFPRFPSQYLPLLEKYAAGEDVDITDDEFNRITLNLSEFTRTVLNAVRKVKRSSTITYGQLAYQIGRPEAVRAVATALGRNPLPVVIPCHRVVAKHSIGGFAFGVDVKRMLLLFESSELLLFCPREK